MSESNQNTSSLEKYLTKICNYIFQTAKQVDVDRYNPYIDLLRRLFVPSIDQRLNTLLGHFVYKEDNSSCLEIPDFTWEDISYSLNNLLRIDGVSSVFVDSILLRNRLDKIARELDRLGFDTSRLEFHLPDACENLYSEDYWINQLSTLIKYKQTASNGNKTDENQRRYLKREASYVEVNTSSNESIVTLTNPFDVLSKDICKDQTQKNIRSRITLRTKRDKYKTCRNDKVKLVVSSDCTRYRNDYLKIPCDSEALKDKIFKNSILELSFSPSESRKLEDRLQSVCVCLNNIINRLDDDVVNDSALFCDFRKHYLRFKLGRMRSNVCMFATRVAIEQPHKTKDKNISQKCNGNISNPIGVNVFKCKITDDTKNKSSGEENVTDCSTRFLWGNDDEKLSSSSIDTVNTNNKETFSICNGQDNYSYVCPRHCKMENKTEDGKSIGCRTPNSKIMKTSCSCSHKKIIYDFNSKNDTQFSSKKNDLKQKECQDIGIMTEDLEKQCYRKRRLSWKDAETITDEIEDPVELTNIYINEISMRYCDNENQTIKNTSINNECLEKNSMDIKTCSDIGINTESKRLEEISTQVFFKEIQFCTCYKNVVDEFEIEDIRFDNQEIDYNCKCDKETSTDEKFTVLEVDNEVSKEFTSTNETPFEEIIRKLRDPTCKSSEFTRAMKSKINEIVELNEKIRENFMIMKMNKSSCTVSVQTITRKESRDSLKVKMGTSLIALESYDNKCCKKSSHPKTNRSGDITKTVSKCVKTCNNTRSGLKENDKNKMKLAEFSNLKNIECKENKFSTSKLIKNSANNTDCGETKRNTVDFCRKSSNPKNIKCNELSEDITNDNKKCDYFICGLSKKNACKTKCQERTESMMSTRKKSSHSKHIKCEDDKRSTMNNMKMCDDSVCEITKYNTKCKVTKTCSDTNNNRLQSRSSVVKRSILTKLSTSTESQLSRQILNCNNNREEKSIDFYVTKTSCYTRDDGPGIIEILTRSEISNCSHSTHKTCRCTKKSNFLNFLSDHLTRESFEKLRCIIQKIIHRFIERSKNIYKYHCKREKCKCDKYEFRKCRLVAGCDRPKEFTSNNRTRYVRQRSRGQFRCRMKAEESLDCGDRLRRCRTEFFLPRNSAYS